MKSPIVFSTSLDLSGGAVTIPQNSNGDEQIVINAFELKVLSTVTITVEYSIDGTIFTNLYTGLTNDEKRRGGVLWRKMRFTKTGGSTSVIGINYAQGITITTNSDAPSSTTITNIPTNTTTADDEANPSTSSNRALGYAYNGTTWDRNRSGLTTVQTTFTGYQNVLTSVKYNATPPTLSDGNIVMLQGDANGLLKNREGYQAGYEDNTLQVATIVERLMSGSSTYSPNVFLNAGANTTLNVKASAASIFGIYCYNANAAVRYIQIHNTATTPAGGATAAITFAIPPNGGAVFIDHAFLVGGGFNLATGAAFAVSTAMGTYTAATAGDHLTVITYK